MPMHLRDGTFYSPMESEHMILRDGKSVDAKQALLYNRYRYIKHLRARWLNEASSFRETSQNGEDVNLNDSYYYYYEDISACDWFYCQLFTMWLWLCLLSSYASHKACCLGYYAGKILTVPLCIASCCFRFISTFLFCIGTNVYFWFALFFIKFCCLLRIAVKSDVYSRTRRNTSKRPKKVIAPTRSKPNIDLSTECGDNKICYWIIHITFLFLKTVPVIVVILFWCKFFYPGHMFQQYPHIGMQNARLETAGSIPAWHILPNPNHDNEKLVEIIHTKPSIILHLRDTGYVDSLHRKEIFQVLSSLGFHIFSPVNPLCKTEVLDAWSYLHEKMEYSVMYLWMEELPFSVIQSLSNEMCSNGQPPANIFIETKHNDDPSRNLEIWSSLCEQSGCKTKFNSIKCPVTQEIDGNKMLDEISSCVGAVALDTDGLKARS